MLILIVMHYLLRTAVQLYIVIDGSSLSYCKHSSCSARLLRCTGQCLLLCDTCRAFESSINLIYHIHSVSGTNFLIFDSFLKAYTAQCLSLLAYYPKSRLSFSSDCPSLLSVSCSDPNTFHHRPLIPAFVDS